MESQSERNKRHKLESQRRIRNAFKKAHGYSMTIHYRFGGQREAALQRDGFRCLRCGMTDEQHKAKWIRPITVDHKDKDVSNNDLDNLQTLCLSCHGRKDILPRLIESQCVHRKEEILALRAGGNTFQKIADETGFSIGAVWKWIKRWEMEPSQ